MTGTSNKLTESSSWGTLAAQVAGFSHIEKDIPCQDAAGAYLLPHPCVVVLDGKGSASHSHLGSQSALEAIHRFLITHRQRLDSILESLDHAKARSDWSLFAKELYNCALSVQLELAEKMQLECKQFEFTLSLAVLGPRWSSWCTVGDSPLVVLKQQILSLIGEPEEKRFANETHFVSNSDPDAKMLQADIFSSAQVQALYAMTDGTASKLIHLRENYPAQIHRNILKFISDSDDTTPLLSNFLSKDHWDLTTGDDRSLAIIYKQTSIESKLQQPLTTPKENHEVTQVIRNAPTPDPPSEDKTRTTVKLLIPQSANISSRRQLLFPPITSNSLY